MTRFAAFLLVFAAAWLWIGCAAKSAPSNAASFEKAQAANSARAYEEFLAAAPADSPRRAEAQTALREARAREALAALSGPARDNEATLARLEREHRGTVAAHEARLLLAKRSLARAAARGEKLEGEKLEKRPEFVWIRDFVYNAPGQEAYAEPQRRAYQEEVLPLAVAAARRLNNIELMAKLLADFPDAPAARDLRGAIEENLRQRAGEWEVVGDLRAYAQAAPSAPALPELERLIRETLAQRAQTEDAPESYDTFARLFPQSPEASDFLMKGEELAYAQAMQGDLAAAEHYLQRFPDSPRVAKVRSRRENLAVDEALAESYRLRYHGPLEEFLAENPDSEAASRAQELVARFDADRQRLEQAGDQQDLLRDFLSASPDSVYATTARSRLAAAGVKANVRDLGGEAPAPFDPSGRDIKTPARLYQDHNLSVVTVVVQYARGASQGSGFFVTPSGHVLTNAHVVEGNPASVSIYTPAGAIPCEVIAMGSTEGLDLALLAPRSALACPWVEFRDSRTCVPGEEVYSIGTPIGMERSISNGIVSGRRTRKEVPYIQHTAAISSGSSGGPLFDAYGMVVGVNTSTLGAPADSASASQRISQNLNFAIAGEEAAKFVAAALGAR
jgi:S1-C subfamily serine protease